MDLVRTTAGKVSGRDRLRRRLRLAHKNLAHKILVTRGIADFDVKNDISRHQELLWAGSCDGQTPGEAITAELTKPMP